MIESTANSAAVFRYYGLSSRRRWGAAGVTADETGSADIALGLPAALEKLGGIYAEFGRFLSWRSDLLDASCIAGLRGIKFDFPVVSLPAVAGIVRRELGPAAEELAASLEGPPLWDTLARTAYHSTYRHRRVIVEVARDPVAEERFAEFEKGLRELKRPAGIVSPVVLSQFRDWVRNGESLARERSFLDVLSRHRGETLAEYPLPIPELSTASVLCWYAVEGRSAAELIAQGNAETPVLIASAILEQFYSLSMVDADLELEAMIVDRNNRLHFRRLNNPIAVLPSLVNNGIKYTSAVLAGNASLSAQALIRLVISHPPLDLEKRLVDEFSGVEPELKINRWFPPSAGAFENNWRALAKLSPSRPLFLDCLHRNLVAAGYWNSDAVRSGAPHRDAIAEAQWPVIAHLIRTQFGMLMNRESASEWAVGSGLVMFGTLREMNRLAEEMRENDLTVGVDIAEPIQRASHRTRFSYGVVLGGLLLVLLMCLLWGATAPAPWSVLLKVLGVSALPAMFWAVSRMG